MPRLYILSGPDLGRTVDVQEGAVLGRAAECAVHLRDPSVSRQHARLERVEGSWRIVDTDSRNGVRVRGERVMSAALADGDEFQVGEVVLRFRAESTPTARNVPAPVLEEIALEKEPEPDPEPLAATTLAPRSVGGVAHRAAPAVETRSKGILQYHKIPDRGGFFASDLSQHPLWIKLVAGLIAVAVFAAIFLFAFKGTSILKSKVSGEASAPEEP